MTESNASDARIDENLEILNLEGFGPIVTLRQITLILEGMAVKKPAMVSTISWILELDRLARACEPVRLATDSEAIRNNLRQVDVPVERTESVALLEQAVTHCVPESVGTGRQVIRVEVECSEHVTCTSRDDLINLLTGIENGCVDGNVTFVD